MSRVGLQRGKDTERAIAKRVKGERLGNTGMATPDVMSDGLVVECKSRESLPLWLVKALTKVVTKAPPGKLPVVVLHQVGKRHDDDIVCLRLRDFEALRPSSDREDKVTMAGHISGNL